MQFPHLPLRGAQWGHGVDGCAIFSDRRKYWGQLFSKPLVAKARRLFRTKTYPKQIPRNIWAARGVFAIRRFLI